MFSKIVNALRNTVGASKYRTFVMHLRYSVVHLRAFTIFENMCEKILTVGRSTAVCPGKFAGALYGISMHLRYRCTNGISSCNGNASKFPVAQTAICRQTANIFVAHVFEHTKYRSFIFPLLHLKFPLLHLFLPLLFEATVFRPCSNGHLATV